MLALLREGPLHTREIVTLRRRSSATYDGTHAALARLEKRGLVEGVRRAQTAERGREARWALTDAGRKHADG